MTDISHQFGGDLTLSATGDLLLSSGGDETDQRVYRRLLTNQGDYLWSLTYGAGLPSMIGQPANATAIEGVIRMQIFAEDAVARAPEPIITTSVSNDGTVVDSITYTDAATGVPSVLTFPAS